MTRKDKKKIQRNSSSRGLPPNQKKAEDEDPFGESQTSVIDPLFMEAIEEISSHLIKAHKKSSGLPQPSPQSVKKQKSLPPTEVDLHGYLLRDALAKIDRAIAPLLKLPEGKKPPKGTTLKIITGKGRHSGADGGVLIKEVYRHVASVYRHAIVKIDNPPAKDKLYGLPLRGFFLVSIR